MRIECSYCMGYGHIGKAGEPTIDRRARKCLDCGGEGQRPLNGREIINHLRVLLDRLRDDEPDETDIPLLGNLVQALDLHLTGKVLLRGPDDAVRAATFIGLNDLSNDCRYGRWVVYLSDGYSRLVLTLRPSEVVVERSLCLPHVLERWDAATGR